MLLYFSLFPILMLGRAQCQSVGNLEENIDVVVYATRSYKPEQEEWAWHSQTPLNASDPGPLANTDTSKARGLNNESIRC